MIGAVRSTREIAVANLHSGWVLWAEVEFSVLLLFNFILINSLRVDIRGKLSTFSINDPCKSEPFSYMGLELMGGVFLL